MGFPLQMVPDPKQRQCGTCTACCTAMGVVELKKSMWQRCEEECDRGCAIYDNRPQSCRDFTCLWLAGNIEGDERRRPDNLGLMFVGQGEKFKDIDLPVIAVWEIRPGALEENSYLLGRLRTKFVLYCIPYYQKTKRRIKADERFRPRIEEILNGLREKVYFGEQ